jgi:hypothetical protein
MGACMPALIPLPRVKPSMKCAYCGRYGDSTNCEGCGAPTNPHTVEPPLPPPDRFDRVCK